MTQAKDPKLHPSGLTWERWQWPFHTEAERQLIAAYFAATERKTKRAEAQAELEALPDAPF